MRILIISNLFPPTVLGGYEILCEQVCSELQEMGHDIRILTTPAAQAETTRFRMDRSLSLYLPFVEPPAYSRFRRWRTHRKNYSVTKRAIGEHQPDLIFIWSQLRLTMGCAFAAERSGIPVAYTMNDQHMAGYRNKEKGLKAAFRRLLDEKLLQIGASQLQLKNVTCISNALKKELCEKGLPLEDAKVIYQGIPVAKFPAKPTLGSIGSPARLLYVGQLHEYKGVHTLLEAAELLSATGHRISVTICGSGDAPYENRLRKMARGGRTRIEFLGRIDHREIPLIYRSHDILVFPSIWSEPFGLSHLEAMASGTTVVSTAEGGHGEFLRDQVNSLIFMPGSAEDLAQKLEMVLDRPGLSASLAQAALAQVSMQFCVLSYARRLAAWLERIRAGQRPANLASDSAAPKRLRAATLSFDISVEPVDWKKV